ncbi:MAG: adenylyl-sulfate kinase [Hyphomicrobiales bacterium]|nr:adenylyl-sulfate kinase [Hyphomicrobiales bacterium]
MSALALASAAASAPAPALDTAAVDLPTLRFITCGSVDDGKSTLIGRLLFERRLIPDDLLATLKRDSLRHGTDGENIDYALLVDGLEAEREQGITIDVAWRYFATPTRSFMVADTPGHEQYTRNMATGASQADCAVVLVDARKGVSRQTRRHAAIVALMGVRHVILAVNKIDLVDYDAGVFHAIAAEFTAFATRLGLEGVVALPVAARFGDNMSARGERLGWFNGPTLIEALERVSLTAKAEPLPFRMWVQWVNRPDLNFRGLAGTIASGSIGVGDSVVMAPSGASARIRRIHTADGDLARATTGDAVSLVLDHEIDAARGDLISTPESRPQVADQFAAHLIWMSADKLLPGRSYLMKIGSRLVPTSLTAIRRRIDVDTLEPLAAATLDLNEIGVCNLSTSVPVSFDAYADNHATGAFILIDRETNVTAAAGMIDFALRRATNVHRQALVINKTERAALKGQKPLILWFTGLSGSGKSTIANLVEARLHALGAHTTLLDGDNMRHGLNRNLGFTNADRVENIRRVGEVAKLMLEAGVIALCSFISPFKADRDMVRALVEPGEFVEIYVETSLEACIARDTKGLYKRALAGQIKNFTGIDQPYEAPQAAELVLTTEGTPAEVLADRVIDYVLAKGLRG